MIVPDDVWTNLSDPWKGLLKSTEFKKLIDLIKSLKVKSYYIKIIIF